MSQYVFLTLRADCKLSPKQSSPCQAHADTRGQGPVPSPDSPLQWRRELTSTAARSTIPILPGGTAAPSPARLTRVPQAGVNQEHFSVWAHSVTECQGQRLVYFPSSLSENKCLSDHCQRRGQSGNPEEGCKEESKKTPKNFHTISYFLLSMFSSPSLFKFFTFISFDS